MNYVKQPWRHQEKAIQDAIKLYEEIKKEARPEAQAGYALFMEPRCGKTGTAINILRYLCNQERRKLRTLIFCPSRVVPNWKVEFGQHSKFDQSKIVLLQGTGKLRVSLFKDGARGEAQIFITNYESLLMPDLFREFSAWNSEFIIFDESHRLKDLGAKRTKLAERLANPRRIHGENELGDPCQSPQPPYKLILTGSPVLNSLMDLYSQFRILDGGETFGYDDYRTGRREPLSFQGFRQTYFFDHNAGMPRHKYFPKWELKLDSLEQISKLIAKKSVRVTRAECLDLPPCEQVTIETELSPEQKKLYTEMKKDFITWFRAQPVTAKLALHQTLRLLQITSGFVKTEEGKELYLHDIPKQTALRELLADLSPSGKCLVWSVFKENYRQIREVCDDLKLPYVEVHGEIGASQQDRNVKAFQEDEKIKVFIGHPESGGEGINLVQAPYNIFYSRNHSLKHSIQASARNQSQDSAHVKTVRYDIIAKNTLDETVANLVIGKEKMADEVYSGIILKNILQDSL